MATAVRERNHDSTIWVGNLADGVDEDLLWELFLQAGPLTDVHMPRDKVNGRAQGFAFVEFSREEDAVYALSIMNMVPMFGNPIRLRKAGANSSSGGALNVGANLFVGNVGTDATEKTLCDTFSAFGIVVDAHVQRDAESGAPRGFAFVNMGSFEAADAAIEALSGQFLGGRQVTVQYAFRKDAPGERHGSMAERTLAAAARAEGGRGGVGGVVAMPTPHTFFASAHGVIDASPYAAGAGARGPLIGGIEAPAMADPALTLTSMPYVTGGAPLPPSIALPTGMQPPPLPPLPAPPTALPVATNIDPSILSGGRRDIRPAWMTAAEKQQ
jgi:splicing factor 3B subunit 4